MQRYSAGLLVVGFMVVLSGCLVTGTSQQTTSGTKVSQTTFAQIEPGKTTVAWIKATLGDPTSKSTTGDDEIWKYTYTEKTDSTGAVFLIFGGSNSKETTSTAFLEIKDGIVIKKWQG